MSTVEQELEELKRLKAWDEFEIRKLKLKTQALSEKITELEDRNADLRVEITISNEEFTKANSELVEKLHKFEEQVMNCQNQHGPVREDDWPTVEVVDA